MTTLSISEKSNIILNRLRDKGESDEALIERVLDYARGFMVIFGMIDEKTEAECFKGLGIYQILDRD